MQEDSFKALMQNVVEEDSHRGTTQSFWKSILGGLSALYKFAAIMLVIPIGSVESWRLGPKHLNVCVQVRRSSYTVHSFTYLVSLAK